jgi:importin subunit alpha-1
MECQVLDCFVDLLDSEDDTIVLVALEGIESILKVGENVAIENNTTNPVALDIQKKNEMFKIEGLQKHKNEEIYKTSKRILENHFDIEVFCI